MATHQGDGGLAAFWRLLMEASGGGQPRVDALVALAQRTVFLPTWSGSNPQPRKLTSSNGDSALPAFSTPDFLRAAASKYGWASPTGDVAFVELGAREALRHVLNQAVTFLILDLETSHALEVHRDEIEPLFSPEARRDAAGPFAAVGRVSSSMMRAVRPTPPPQPYASLDQKVHAKPSSSAAGAGEDTSSSRSRYVMVSESPAKQAPALAATFGSGSKATIHAPQAETPEAVVDALTVVLRAYPEVEWAALCAISRGPAAAVPAVALRVDSGFRMRVSELLVELRKAASDQGATLDFLLLDDAEHIQKVRQLGVAFYPWKRQ